jgi:hypothetical protein
MLSGMTSSLFFFASQFKNRSMENIPATVYIIFVLTTFLTVFIFYKAAHQSKSFISMIIVWLVLQSAVSLTGFYTVTDTRPPHFVLLIAPALLAILALFITSKGRKFLDGLNPKYLTMLHAVRIPVELVLYWLFLRKTIPQVMTFEGRNFDILSGLSAPIVFYLVYRKKVFGNKILLLWNFFGLALLINIVTLAVLSAPFQFQQLAFDQPNVAVLYFPFIWLPCCIVPLVLLSHLAQIRQLIYKHENSIVHLTGTPT